MPQTPFTYTINPQSYEANFLKALAQYNQKIKIVNVIEDDTEQDLELYEDKTGKDIPELVEKAKNSQVSEIIFKCGRSDSLFAIFPKINPTDPNQYLQTTGQENLFDRFCSLNSDMNRVSGPVELEPISEEEALNLIRSKCVISEVSGAIHLADIKSIVFESEGYCYVLSYGDKTSIKCIKEIAFNVEHGFMFPYISQSAYADEACDKLQEFFSQWKDNNYQGKLFPSSMGVNPVLVSSKLQDVQEKTDVRFFVSQAKNPVEKNGKQQSTPAPSLQLTHDMIMAAGKQKEIGAKIKAVKGVLFQTLWLEELVKKFSYQKTSSTYFVSFDRYDQDHDRIRFIAQLIDYISKTGALKIKTVTIRHDRTLFQIQDEAIESVHQAEVIIYIRSKNNVSNRYLMREDDAVVEKNAKIIPIVLNAQSNAFLPKTLQKLPYLTLGESDIGLELSKFFSKLLHRMGILNDTDKGAFDKASEDLIRQIDSQYTDEHIADVIAINDKKAEAELRGILGL